MPFCLILDACVNDAFAVVRDHVSSGSSHNGANIDGCSFLGIGKANNLLAPAYTFMNSAGPLIGIDAGMGCNPLKDKSVLADALPFLDKIPIGAR